ncbi:unnamed protein product [Durusdinium trenchii]|uniref:Uncharacterized protein n=1 Tax=Durusdinium trenchii TaxID=1381693 RepID=A0ABP0T0S8_9DINO
MLFFAVIDSCDLSQTCFSLTAFSPQMFPACLDTDCGSSPPMGLMIKHFLSFAVAAAKSSSLRKHQSTSRSDELAKQQHRRLASALFRRCRLAVVFVVSGGWPTVRKLRLLSCGLCRVLPRQPRQIDQDDQVFTGCSVLRCRAFRDLCTARCAHWGHPARQGPKSSVAVIGATRS